LHYLIKSNVPLNRAGTALEADDYDLLDSEERIYQKESWAEFVKMGMTVEMRWRDTEDRPQQAAPPTEDPNNATHQLEVEVEAAAAEPGSIRREEITIIVDEEPFPIRIEDARTREVRSLTLLKA
jgi:Ubiquitin-like domain